MERGAGIIRSAFDARMSTYPHQEKDSRRAHRHPQETADLTLPHLRCRPQLTLGCLFRLLPQSPMKIPSKRRELTSSNRTNPD